MALTNPPQQRTDDERELTFVEHLDELRGTLFKAIIGLILATIGCAFFIEWIVQDLLMKPLVKVGLQAQVLTPYGIVMLYFQAALFGGFILSMPNTLFWLWDFIRPGLYKHERRYASFLVFFTALCFFAGVAFAYFILIPFALNFFSTFGTDNIQLNVAINEYVSFLLTLILGAGLVFELPVITYVLTRFGLITPAFLRKYRRHAIVVILIVAALITPTPDIFTQAIMAAPLFVLYEVSIFISAVTLKRKIKREESEE